MSKYRECYVAFLDILGFKNIVYNYDAEDIYNIFQKIEDAELKQAVKFEDSSKNIPLEDVKKYIMSDSIILYIESSKKRALEAIIKQCLLLARQLFKHKKPILLRGAITKGKFLRKGSVVFGPALSDSYLLQEYSSIYPRIIIKESDIPEDEIEEINKYTYIDDDKYRCIDYFEYQDNVDYFNELLKSETIKSIRDKYLYIIKKLSN